MVKIKGVEYLGPYWSGLEGGMLTPRLHRLHLSGLLLHLMRAAQDQCAAHTQMTVLCGVGHTS